MTVDDIYSEAVNQKTKSIILLIEYLVTERKVIRFDDDVSKLDYFMQEKYRRKMLEYLSMYEEQKNGKRAV